VLSWKLLEVIMENQIGWLTFGPDSAFSRCIDCKRAGGTAKILPVFLAQIPEGASWVCSTEGCDRIVVGTGDYGTRLFYRYRSIRYFPNRDLGTTNVLAEEIIEELIREFWKNGANL
jgi:hypothetical protein